MSAAYEIIVLRSFCTLFAVALKSGVCFKIKLSFYCNAFTISTHAFFLILLIFIVLT